MTIQVPRIRFRGPAKQEENDEGGQDRKNPIPASYPRFDPAPEPERDVPDDNDQDAPRKDIDTPRRGDDRMFFAE